MANRFIVSIQQRLWKRRISRFMRQQMTQSPEIVSDDEIIKELEMSFLFSPDASTDDEGDERATPARLPPTMPVVGLTAYTIGPLLAWFSGSMP